jgi:hypothetical protein
MLTSLVDADAIVLRTGTRSVCEIDFLASASPSQSADDAASWRRDGIAAKNNVAVLPLPSPVEAWRSASAAHFPRKRVKALAGKSFRV